MKMVENTRILTEDEVNSFLEDLNALTKKHKIVIGGCGCCGSPSLDTLEDYDVGETGRYHTAGGIYGKFDPTCLEWR